MADGVAHLTQAIAAAQAAGTILNPYQSQHLLGPVVSAVNETMAKLREFKFEVARTKELRASVYKQGEAMVLKLKQQLEQGHITEDELNSRCRSVTVWQSTKDSGLDVKLGELEADVCTASGRCIQLDSGCLEQTCFKGRTATHGAHSGAGRDHDGCRPGSER